MKHFLNTIEGSLMMGQRGPEHVVLYNIIVILIKLDAFVGLNSNS